MPNTVCTCAAHSHPSLSLERAAPLSRSQHSLIRADAERGVTQDLALAGQYWRHLKVAKVFAKVTRFVARRF